MKNNIKHGLLFLGASIICAILFLYLWNTQILDDPLTLEGSPNAIRMGHCIIQWILFIATFVLAITAICIFGNEREDYSNVNIKKKWIVIPGIIILFISPIGAIIKLYNKNIPIRATVCS